MSAIRDRRAKRVKICRECGGRGAGPQVVKKGFSSRIKQGFFDEVSGTYRWETVFIRQIACRRCKGSGLNCSMARAIELERSGP